MVRQPWRFSSFSAVGALVGLGQCRARQALAPIRVFEPLYVQGATVRSSARNSRLLFWEVNIPEPFELRKNIVDIAFQASAARIDVVRMRQRALELGDLGCQFAHTLFLGRGLPRLHDAFTAEMLRRTLARESKSGHYIRVRSYCGSVRSHGHLLDHLVGHWVPAGMIGDKQVTQDVMIAARSTTR
jgi:hypothetical protein